MTEGLERWLFVCSSGHRDTGVVGANANSGTGVRNGLIVSCTLHGPVGWWHSPALVFCRLMVPLLARHPFTRTALSRLHVSPLLMACENQPALSTYEGRCACAGFTAKSGWLGTFSTCPRLAHVLAHVATPGDTARREQRGRGSREDSAIRCEWPKLAVQGPWPPTNSFKVQRRQLNMQLSTFNIQKQRKPLPGTLVSDSDSARGTTMTREPGVP